MCSEVVLHEFKTLRAELRCIKDACKSNKAKTGLTAQINKLNSIIKILEVEERNDMRKMR